MSPLKRRTAVSPSVRVYRLMRAALADLPAQYADRIANVDFIVSRHPPRRTRARLDLRGGSLYGLYEGVPLIHRDTSYGNRPPDKITLFWGPLVRDFTDDGTLEAEVRNTLYHEIAHYFGLEEDDLDDTRVK
jgi:predicted Zn-dependent protease with MMP-like domain